MEYVALLRHGVESCPSANGRVNELVGQMLPKMLEIGSKHQVALRSSHVLSPTHLAVLILDAPSIEAARNFLEEGGITQWNDVELYPSMSIEERLETSARLALPPIW
jgi:hypothetical protein